METIIPQKRSSPSAPLTDVNPAYTPHGSKQLARLDASHLTSSAQTDSKVRGFRTPKMFKGIEEWKPSEMGPMETTYLSTQFEVDDSSEYKEALLAMEGLVAKSAFPTRQHIRQVLALCFFPLLFKPPTRISAFARTSSSAIATKAVLPPFDQDPFNLSHKKLREETRKVLDDLIATNGTEVVCQSIKGYGMPKLPKVAPTAPEDPFKSPAAPTQALPPDSPPISKKTKRNPKAVVAKGKGKGKGKEKGKPSSDSDEDFSLSDSDDVLAISAKRIGQTEHLWDFLAGTVAKKQRVWTREQPILDGGWEVLRSLVDGWEVEAETKSQLAHSSDTPVQPLSLMRYFKPSATASNARELSSKAFDVAFWPFTDLALPKTDLDSDESDKDSEDDDDLFSDDDFNDKSRGKGKGKGKTVPEKAKKEEEEVKFEGGMSLEEKKQVGIRLLCLIGDSSTVGHFDGTATLAEVVQRMKALDHASFSSFLELLSLHASPASPFVPRLLAAYLETHSHPISASASLDISALADLSSSTLAASSSSDLLTSPRKRALAAQHSMNSFRADDTSNSSQSQSQGISAPIPTQTEAEVEAEFWKTPTIESREFLTLVSRIPIEVPLPQESTSGTAGGGPGGRKPKGIVGSFKRAERAADCHRLVKEVLIACQVAANEASDQEQGQKDKSMKRVQRLLQGVEEAVEQARTRRESK